MALERFLANEWDKARAQKRGGGVPTLPLQWDSAETRYGSEPADPRTPEQAFERRWAIALLDEVLRQLEAEQQAEGKAVQFAALKPCLAGESASLSYAQIADATGLSEGAVSRWRCTACAIGAGDLLRAEIAQTVVWPRTSMPRCGICFRFCPGDDEAVRAMNWGRCCNLTMPDLRGAPVSHDQGVDTATSSPRRPPGSERGPGEDRRFRHCGR